MILLVSPSSKGKQALVTLEKACNMAVWLVLNLEQAPQALESNEYLALVVDQAVLDTDPDAVGFLLRRARLALPIFVSFAVACPERVAAEVRSGLARNDQIVRRAQQVAKEEVWSELKDIVTGMLLECDLCRSFPP